MLLLVVVLPVPCPGAPPEDRPVSGSRGPTLGETPAPEGLAQGGPFLPEGRTSFRAHSENEAEMKQVPAGDVPTSIQVFGKRWPSTGAGQALGPVAGVSQGRPTSEGRTTVQVQQFLQHQRTGGGSDRIHQWSHLIGAALGASVGTRQLQVLGHQTDPTLLSCSSESGRGGHRGKGIKSISECISNSVER